MSPRAISPITQIQHPFVFSSDKVWYVSMSGLHSKGQVINLKELNADDLKRIITIQQREILVKNERLKGVEDLTRICSELEEKRQSLQIKADNYETALKRAKARVAYLNKKLGIAPQMTLDIDVTNPEVANKNIRPTELGGNGQILWLYVWL